MNLSDAPKNHVSKSIGFRCKEAELFPEMVLLAVSSPCNLRCVNCPMTHLPSIRKTVGPDGGPAPFLKSEYYRKLTEECLSHASGSFKPRIRISGYGEPLVHPEMVEMIEYSCARGVPTSLITNGQLLDVEKSRRLVEAGIESVEISADSDNKDTYEAMRVGGSFERLLDNVRNLVSAREAAAKKGGSRVFLIGSMVRTPENNGDVERIRGFWLDQGFDHISVRKFLTWGVKELMARQKALGDGFYMGQEEPCPCPFERVLIDPAGYIRLCPYDDQKKIPDFGHLGADTIASAWKDERFRRIRACHSQPFDHEGAKTDAPLCAGCEDRRNRSWTFNYFSIADRMKNQDAGNAG